MTDEKPRFGQQSRTLESQTEPLSERVLSNEQKEEQEILKKTEAKDLSDWRTHLDENDKRCPYWQKLDALGDAASWEKHQAWDAIWNEWQKERAKEHVPNDFHKKELWLNYIIAEAKCKFIDEELEMWKPSYEGDWEEMFDPDWEKEMTNDTN